MNHSRKRTRHYKLEQVRKLIEEGKYDSKFKARTTAARDFGFDQNDMATAILKLEATDFEFSMTTYKNSKEWQDVYRSRYLGEDIYLKFTVKEQVLIWSFAEYGNDM